MINFREHESTRMTYPEMGKFWLQKIPHFRIRHQSTSLPFKVLETKFVEIRTHSNISYVSGSYELY